MIGPPTATGPAGTGEAGQHLVAGRAARVGTWAGLAACALLFLGLALAIRGRMAGTVIDDAYISFRYAANLAHGYGPIFNVGERVEGYTDFLWVLALAAADRMRVDPGLASQFLGTLAGLGLLFAAWRLTKAVLGTGTTPYAVVPGLLIASTPLYAYMAVWGLETIPFLLWTCLAALCFVRGLASPRYLWIMGLCLALAALTRPEGILLFGITWLYSIFDLLGREGKPSVTRVLWPWLFLAVFAPYFAWRWRFYGDFLPNTFYAKVGSGASQYVRGLRYLWEHLSAPYMSPMLPLVACALWPGRRIASGISYLGVTAAVYAAYVVYVGGDSFGVRLLLPAVLLYYVLGAAGLARLNLWLAQGLLRPVRHVPAAALLVIWLVLGQLGQLPRTGELIPGLRAGTYNQQSWVELGRWLHANVPSDAVLAVDGAGAIPFYSELRTIDMLGLNDRQIAHESVADMGAGTPGHEKYDPAYVLGRRPDFIATWLDEDGMPGWGLNSYLAIGNYDLFVVSRQVEGSVESERVRLVNLPEIDYAALRQQGYTYGVLRLRSGLAAGQIVYNAASPYLSSNIGSRVRDPAATSGWALCTRTGSEEGMLAFGPYRRTAPGDYEAVFRLRGGAPTKTGAAATLDVLAWSQQSVGGERRSQTLARREVLASELPNAGQYVDITVPFTLIAEMGPDLLETRVQGGYLASLCLDRVLVQATVAGFRSPP